jgi:hypothetical protein
MAKSAGKEMSDFTIRSLCVAGVLACSAGIAPAYAASHALDLSSYNTVVDRNAAPRARLAGQFDLGLPGDLPVLAYGPQQIAQIGLNDRIVHVPLLDGVSLDFGAGLDFAGKFDRFDAAGSSDYDGLFFSASAVNSPYVSLADGGTLAGLTADLANGLHLSVGAASVAQGTGADWMSPSSTVARLGGAPLPYDTRSASALLAGVSWDFASWGGVGVNAARIDERDGLLGVFDPSVPSASTSSVGVSARVQLGSGWTTTASFADAITKLDLKPGFGVSSNSLHTRSYGIAVAKRGLFGNDAMGLAVTRPAGGGDDLALVSGIDGRSQLVNVERLLESRTPETDFELGYVTTFLDGSLALQTNAAYQMNFAGQTGTSSVSFLSRAKIKF